ncbi:GntR family transcriptional regulator [Clostridium botulinum]|uniref:Transcriptional regulator YtrA n=1 Tax=Clostridium botulinum (strain Eklund 17B / Type B) TaxID=935198 RepID=B2TKY6_CLOBB|nr:MULTISPECIES: GntR family transcriptional regulator [unclassified Clostridium]ACD23538.1 transcriptional regulator YtrA [Clostridium botulinum B str. Eklund 17B (NRP)]MBY6974528.1 GntR family transcriptional regulator [Clostridium botulinum]MBY6999513.1 GntR family transcriptional regulator [Clostridium botulinum]MCR1275264.1 GntR family transcriptional regulator [Clostridium botulinum]NFD70500.1 GntR family transcriptional regulator [Clostridium botulinum]
MIKVDPRSSTPIYEQVELRIKELILKGALNEGEKLPSVRELSSILTINPNTISKAYKELEREGIIETLRGKGTFITHNIKATTDSKKIEKIREELKNLILEASYVSIDKEKFLSIVQVIFDELGGKNRDSSR